MTNPWNNFPKSAPFITEMDAPFIAEYNAKATPDFKLHTDVMPAPYNGGLDSARIVFLSLNPGYDPNDNLRSNEYRQAIRDNLADPYGYDDFVYLNKQFSTLNINGRNEQDPGYKWWRSKTHFLTDVCGPISGRFLSLEWFPYASKKFKAPNKIFPSQHFTFELLREAMRRQKPIVILRGKTNWINSVPELATYNRLFELRSAQNICVSPNNIKDDRFNEIIDIIKG